MRSSASDLDWCNSKVMISTLHALIPAYLLPIPTQLLLPQILPQPCSLIEDFCTPVILKASFSGFGVGSVGAGEGRGAYMLCLVFRWVKPHLRGIRRASASHFSWLSFTTTDFYYGMFVFQHHRLLFWDVLTFILGCFEMLFMSPSCHLGSFK